MSSSGEPPSKSGSGIGVACTSACFESTKVACAVNLTPAKAHRRGRKAPEWVVCPSRPLGNNPRIVRSLKLWFVSACRDCGRPKPKMTSYCDECAERRGISVGKSGEDDPASRYEADLRVSS
jgi:hypothetical protein